MVAEGRQVMANVHITPMRASRALALRYLATKFGVDVETLAVRGRALPPFPLGCAWNIENTLVFSRKY
jgi:hypothetical protein